jgi:hypothetical protein
MFLKGTDVVDHFVNHTSPHELPLQYWTNPMNVSHRPWFGILAVLVVGVTTGTIAAGAANEADVIFKAYANAFFALDGAITENGKPVNHTEGVKCLRQEIGEAVSELRSGNYRFASQKAASEISL